MIFNPEKTRRSQNDDRVSFTYNNNDCLNWSLISNCGRERSFFVETMPVIANNDVQMFAQSRFTKCQYDLLSMMWRTTRAMCDSIAIIATSGNFHSLIKTDDL